VNVNSCLTVFSPIHVTDWYWVRLSDAETSAPIVTEPFLNPTSIELDRTIPTVVSMVSDSVFEIPTLISNDRVKELLALCE